MIYLTIEFDGLIHQNYKHGATYWPNPLWVASKIQLLLFHWTMSVLCKSSVGTVLIGASARGEVVPILCHLWKLQICRPSPPWPFWQIRSGDKLQWRDIPSGNLTQLLKMTIIYIYSGFTHCKMVIFHSYVSWSEGKQSSELPQVESLEGWDGISGHCRLLLRAQRGRCWSWLAKDNTCVAGQGHSRTIMGFKFGRAITWDLSASHFLKMPWRFLSGGRIPSNCIPNRGENVKIDSWIGNDWDL